MPEQLTNNTLAGDIVHEWTIQEYEQYSRSTLWYILAGITGTVMVLIGIFSGNFLFSLIIILFAIILFLQSHQTPPQVSFKITELGIVLGNRFYKYSELGEFFIVYNPAEAVKMLFINTKSILRPILRIPLLDQNPLKVKQTLSEFLPEDIDREEPLTDRASRNWRIY